MAIVVALSGAVALGDTYPENAVVTLNSGSGTWNSELECREYSITDSEVEIGYSKCLIWLDQNATQAGKKYLVNLPEAGLAVTGTGARDILSLHNEMSGDGGIEVIINGSIQFELTDTILSDSFGVVTSHTAGQVGPLTTKITGDLNIELKGKTVYSGMSGGIIATGNFSVVGDIFLSAENVQDSIDESGTTFAGILLGSSEQVDLQSQEYAYSFNNVNLSSINITCTKTKAQLFGRGFAISNYNKTDVTLEGLQITGVASTATYSEAYGISILNPNGILANMKVKRAASISGIKAISTNDATDAYAYASGIEVNANGSIVFEDSLVVKDIIAESAQDAEAYAITSIGGGAIRATSGKDTVVEGDIFVMSDADLSGTEDAQVDIAFTTQNSYFKGLALDGVDYNPYGAPFQPCTTHLTFGNGGYWELTGYNSTKAEVTERYTEHLRGSLTMLENGHVYLHEKEAAQPAITDATPARTLVVDTLKGDGGVFHMRAEITADTDRADHLILEQASEGSHYILVKGSGSGGKKEMSDYLVRRQGGTAEFSMANAKGMVDIGVYNYGLKSRYTAEGKEWYLAKVKLTPKPGPAISPTGEAVLALTSPSAQTALFLQNISSLRKRLGEIRTCRQADIGSAYPVAVDKNGQAEVPRRAGHEFYARALAGHDTVPGYRGMDFRNNYWGAAVGYLRHLNKKWLFGAEFNSVEGKQRLARPRYTSKGESESYGILLSGTWHNDKGSYCDFVFSWEHYEQKLNTYMLDGTPVHGSFSSLSPGLSVEVGRKFMPGERKKWFVEPQAQLTFYHAGGDSYMTSNGMLVNRHDANSLTGRLGVAMGKTHRDGNAKGLQWHVDVGVLHEFLGEPKATINGESFSASTLGTRIYYGLGGDYILNRRTQIYGYIGQENGPDYESDYNACLGVRISF